jgi:Icc-related predicted phosphoesterase
MQILQLSAKPFYRTSYLNAARGGGVEQQHLPWFKGTISRLPQGLDALLVTSDLQGVVRDWHTQQTELLGIAVTRAYQELYLQGLVPQPAKVGVILAGDLYAAPNGDKRGASGNVSSVWLAFAQRFKWVAGVQGNHDRFGSDRQKLNLQYRDNIFLFDYEVAELGNICIGGVSGVMGDPVKEAYKLEADFLTELGLVLDQSPDLLILHQGPFGQHAQRGSALVQAALLRKPPALTVCGHVHWENPLAQLTSTSQILNVDSRVVLLSLSN